MYFSPNIVRVIKSGRMRWAEYVARMGEERGVCDSTREQRENMIRHIGAWPTSKQNLINKYQKIFSRFVESIDFDDVQQSAQ